MTGLHLQFGADAASEVVVSWHTTASVTRPRVIFGRPDGGLGTARDADTVTYRDAQSGTEVQIHHTRVNGLTPNTDYIYAAGQQPTDTRSPTPTQTTTDVLDTSRGTVHMVIGGGGTSAPPTGNSSHRPLRRAHRRRQLHPDPAPLDLKQRRPAHNPTRASDAVEGPAPPKPARRWVPGQRETPLCFGNQSISVALKTEARRRHE